MGDAMFDILITLLIMVVCLAAEAFFSGSEIGIVSADRMRLRHEAAKGSRGARLALEMLKTPEWLLSTTLVGTNISVVTNTTVATALAIELFGREGSLVAIGVVAPLIWVFGEIVPKSVFQQRADALTPKAIFLLKFCSYLFYPILLVFSFLSRLLARLLGGGQRDVNPFTLREQISTMLEMSTDDGDIRPMEQQMIRRLFDFGETTAREAMVPLIDVVCVDQATTCGEAVGLAVERSHKRLPVYAERVDQLTGVLDTLDLLGVDPGQPIAPFVRPVDYVPETRSIQDVLLDMRRVGQIMSVVVDEFGGAEGIITVEDIVEEVVEDMHDEYDADEKPTGWVRRLGERDYVVSARIGLDELKEKLHVQLPEGQYTSLAGFLLEKARDVPPAGTVIDFQKFSFTVQRATPQAIQEVRLRW
jgi:putative hemolysin